MCVQECRKCVCRNVGSVCVCVCRNVGMYVCVYIYVCMYVYVYVPVCVCFIKGSLSPRIRLDSISLGPLVLYTCHQLFKEMIKLDSALFQSRVSVIRGDARWLAY